MTRSEFRALWYDDPTTLNLIQTVTPELQELDPRVRGVKVYQDVEHQLVQVTVLRGQTSGADVARESELLLRGHASIEEMYHRAISMWVPLFLSVRVTVREVQ